jgi:MFS family permease
MAYVTSWFDRHRGSAVALVSSGQYVAGAVWPLLLQLGVNELGWRRTMRLYAVVSRSRSRLWQPSSSAARPSSPRVPPVAPRAR